MFENEKDLMIKRNLKVNYLKK